MAQQCAGGSLKDQGRLEDQQQELLRLGREKTQFISQLKNEGRILVEEDEDERKEGKEGKKEKEKEENSIFRTSSILG